MNQENLIKVKNKLRPIQKKNDKTEIHTCVCFQPGRSPLGLLCRANKYRFNYTCNKNITFMSKNTSKITYDPSTHRSQTKWKISGIYQESGSSLPNKIQASLIYNDLSEVSLTLRERHKSQVRVDTTNYMPSKYCQLYFNVILLKKKVLYFLLCFILYT